MESKSRKLLCIIDGNALMHRAFHALPPLSTRDGKRVQAVYGFATVLLKVIREMNPSYVAVTFDLPEPTFRHEAFEGYKANRSKTPDDLISQFPIVKEMVKLLNIPMYEKAGFEADDIIGTIVAKTEASHPDAELLIVTGDLDTLQLVSEKTHVYTMKKGMSDSVIYDREAVCSRYGISPGQLPDFKGLKGDPSDNIPGVKGIGEKTACRVIQITRDLEGLYRELDKKKPDLKGISPGIQKKLKEEQSAAFFSRELSIIKKDVDIAFSLNDCLLKEPDIATLKPFFESLEFHSLVKRLFHNGSSRKNKKSELRIINSLDSVSVRAWFRQCRDAKRLAIHAGQGGVWHCACDDKSVARFEHQDIDRYRGEWLPLFTNPSIGRIFHGAKHIYRFLLEHDIPFLKDACDIEIAAYLLNPEKKDYSVARIIRQETGDDGELPGAVCKFFTINSKLLDKLEKENLLKVYKEIELPLIPILADMERSGILLDSALLKNVKKTLDKKIHSLEKEIHSGAGKEFNILSPVQLSEILFQKLGLGAEEIRKTPGGALSTRAQELQRLRGKHPIVDKILEYRELTKLQSTYVETLPSLIRYETGRIHTTFIQTGTATGRLASANPNLQNIPVRSDTGRIIRDAFQAQLGWTFVSFDYSQIELRIIAGLAKDDAMIDAFKRGEDIHAKTASLVHHISLEQVTSEQRRAAKALNFGIIYGIGVRSFADSAGITRAEAKDFFSAYFREFCGVRDYLSSVRDDARTHGFVATFFGRKRLLPQIAGGGWQSRQAEERMAVNMPIQGTAADLVKLVMIQVSDKLASTPQLSGRVRLLIQVHDELLFEADINILKDMVLLIKPIMEGTLPDFPVPFVVEIKVGPRWGSMRSYS